MLDSSTSGSGKAERNNKAWPANWPTCVLASDDTWCTKLTGEAIVGDMVTMW